MENFVQKSWIRLVRNMQNEVMGINDRYNNWGFVMVMLGLVMTLTYIASHIY